MSNELVIHEGAEVITQNDWGRVQHWIGLAARFGRCSIACQVMAGFELLALHEQHQVRTGPKQNNLGHSGLNSWRELIERELQIPGRTGDRWMHMAKLFVAKFGKLEAPERLRMLLGVSPQDWGTDDTNFIINFLDEVTEGKSQREFMIDLGLRKKSKVVKVPGGESNKNTLPEPEGKNTTNGTDRTNVTAELALRDWREVDEKMERYGLKFVALEEGVVVEQMRSGLQWLEARRQWLGLEPEERTLSNLERRLLESAAKWPIVKNSG